MAANTSPVICLIGVSPELCQVLGVYLGDKFHLIAVNRQFDVNQLEVYSNILLFICDTDQPYIKLDFVLSVLKGEEKYQNVPLIGLSLKQHYAEMDPQIKSRFEDIILVPASNEDILTRVEVWICTYQAICDPETENKTFALDTMNL